MTTIFDFQIRSISSENYQLKLFERGQSQPLTRAAFDYPLSFLTGFELNHLDFDGRDWPAGQGRLQVDFKNEDKLGILESNLESKYHLFHFTDHGIALTDDGGSLLVENEYSQRRPAAVQEILYVLVVQIRDGRRAIGIHLQTMIQVSLEKNYVCKIN